MSNSLTVLFSATLVSCDSNNSDGDLNLPGGLGTLTAIIDGVSWSAVTATATRVTNVPIPTIIIADAGAGMGLGFADVSETGAFTFSSSNITSMSWTPNSSSGSFIATNGTATITTFTDDRLKGTFSFEGRRVSDGATVSVINGAFDVGNGLSPF